jgi:hypothetical protein
MLHIDPNEYDRRMLVYIPTRAEKGDCPYCYTGVLRRDDDVQRVFNCKEGYICAECGTVFLEFGNRYYGRVAVWKGLQKRYKRR